MSTPVEQLPPRAPLVPESGPEDLGPRLSSRAAAIRWLAGLSILTLCSWARCLVTGSPKVDEHYPSQAAGTLLLLAMCLGWALAVTGWGRMLADPPGRPRRLFYLGLLAVVGMLPLLSNDLFSLLAQADLSSRGKDVYSSAMAYPESVWFSWIGIRWRESPSPYGPITLLAAWPSVLGGANPYRAEAWLKLAWLVPLVALFEISLRAVPDRPAFHAMIWLNPLFLVEGPGQLHPDLLGALLITAGLLLRRRAPRVGAGMAWSLAVLGKLNFGLAFPWFWLSGTSGWAQRVRRGALLALCLGAAAALAYAPFWHGPGTVRGQLRGLATSTMVPGGTLVDVAGTVAGAFASGRLNLDRLVETFDARQQQARARATRAAQVLATLLALAAILPLGLGLLRRLDEERLALATGAFVVAVVTLGSPRFQSWYLLVALPFFGLSCPPAWRRWWVWAVGFAVLPEFSVALPRSVPLLIPWGATTLLSVLVFLAWFRARFWAFADAPARSAAPR